MQCRIVSIIASISHVHGTLLTLLRIAPDTSLMQDSLIQARVTVLIRVLWIIGRILIDELTVLRLITFDKVFCRIVSSISLKTSRESARSIELLNDSCAPL